MGKLWGVREQKGIDLLDGDQTAAIEAQLTVGPLHSAAVANGPNCTAAMCVLVGASVAIHVLRQIGQRRPLIGYRGAQLGQQGGFDGAGKLDWPKQPTSKGSRMSPSVSTASCLDAWAAVVWSVTSTPRVRLGNWKFRDTFGSIKERCFHSCQSKKESVCASC